MTPIQMEVAEALRDSDAGNEERDAVVAIIERRSAEAAARAVDEALSVEALAAALDKLEVVGWVAMRYGKFNMAYYEKLAAALVAHLRGPRPEGEG